MAFIRGRIAFGPEALSRFTQIIEEVSSWSWLATAFLPHRCSSFLVDRYSN